MEHILEDTLTLCHNHLWIWKLQKLYFVSQGQSQIIAKFMNLANEIFGFFCLFFSSSQLYSLDFIYSLFRILLTPLHTSLSISNILKFIYIVRVTILNMAMWFLQGDFGNVEEMWKIDNYKIMWYYHKVHTYRMLWYRGHLSKTWEMQKPS